MRQKEYFIGNPNDCAKRRLLNAGVPLNDMVKEGGITYIGAWVSQRTAQKIYHCCSNNGDVTGRTNHAFELFWGQKHPIKIEGHAIAATLAINVPKMSKRNPGHTLRKFSHDSPALA